MQHSSVLGTLFLRRFYLCTWYGCLNRGYVSFGCFGLGYFGTLGTLVLGILGLWGYWPLVFWDFGYIGPW